MPIHGDSPVSKGKDRNHLGYPAEVSLSILLPLAFMQSRTVAVRLQRLEASFDRLEPGVGRRGASPGNTHEMVDVTLVTTHPFLSTRPPGVDLGKQDKEPPLSGPLRELLELMGQDTSKAQRQALKASVHSVATSG